MKSLIASGQYELITLVTSITPMVNELLVIFPNAQDHFIPTIADPSQIDVLWHFYFI